ncbi:MAG: cell envelope integrity EipB family protein [Alphaproteobacteria bacterium]|nr:cell envelope integrity EipB family protein [Alphaproteobacteria bacterium]
MQTRWFGALLVAAVLGSSGTVTLAGRVTAGDAVAGGQSPATAPQPTTTIDFRPHRAVYDISLARVSTGSSVANIDGRMVYELAGNTCEGHTETLRFVTRTTNQRGDVRLTDLRTANWESAKSDTFRFDSKNYHDNTLAQATNGAATRTGARGVINVQLKKPKRKSLTLDSKALYPIAHAKAIVRAAKNGDRIYQGLFFDGSDTGEKVYQTTAIIGKKLLTAATPGSTAAALVKPDVRAVAGWPISASYFEDGKTGGDATPAFEMSYHFHINGVISKFMIDHGDFAFNGALTQLEYTASTGCGASAKTPTP